jgi:hypothetical protein
MSKPVIETGQKRRVGDGTPGPGRPKGSQNKATKALKDMILGALDQAGGQAYLAAQAEENPAAFLTLIGKVLPSEIKAEHSGPDGGPVNLSVSVELVRPAS